MTISYCRQCIAFKKKVYIVLRVLLATYRRCGRSYRLMIRSARHCLADGSNELQCPQRKNVGTAVSCSSVIRVLLYYCMYVSLLANWNRGRYWDHALETVNCVCSGKCCRQLIPKCDRPGEEWVFVAVFFKLKKFSGERPAMSVTGTCTTIQVL
jgi:hypothetical protein